MYILGSTLLYWILFTFLDTLGDTTNRIAILHSLLCGLQCLNNSNRLSSPILDITLQQSSLESVADAVAVEPISMIYIFGWLGPGQTRFFLRKPSLSLERLIYIIKSVYILLSSKYFHKQFLEQSSFSLCKIFGLDKL